jgi:predicted Zn-dependent protease
MSLGSQINDELLKGNGVVLYKNTQVNQYIDTIGQKIAKNSGRPKLTYTFQVVDDNSINAFATMGGYVYLNTGLLKAAEDESEVASVLSHEIGHIVRRHAIKQMRSSAITQGVLSAAGLETSQAVQIGVDLALSKPNSRQDEYEADDTGLTMLRKTGYAPAGMVTFMRKLEQQQGSSSVPTFLSTHPATSERIKVLQKKIDITTANTGNGLDRQAYRNAIKPIF